ncbi:MAG: phosphomannose isomerase type II C-terminal cupin domain [Candidatus Marsarchaeota archaeon]|nr:phosphomannose isomerase type II C-terminal cupin domain [Candidatus Marsarchaeota archaeon]
MLSKKVVDVRPWGSEDWFVTNEKCTVKLLYVKKGKRNSYQYHNNRESEFWHIVSGQVLVTLDDKELTLGQGEDIMVPKRAKHRFYGITDATILEIISGEFDERDIVRLQDDFSRK